MNTLSAAYRSLRRESLRCLRSAQTMVRFCFCDGPEADCEFVGSDAYEAWLLLTEAAALWEQAKAVRSVSRRCCYLNGGVAAMEIR